MRRNKRRQTETNQAQIQPAGRFDYRQSSGNERARLESSAVIYEAKLYCEILGKYGEFYQTCEVGDRGMQDRLRKRASFSCSSPKTRKSKYVQILQNACHSMNFQLIFPYLRGKTICLQGPFTQAIFMQLLPRLPPAIFVTAKLHRVLSMLET